MKALRDAEFLDSEFFKYTVVASTTGLMIASIAILIDYDLDLLRTIALTVAAVAQTLFVALYLTFSWYKNFLGRALFGKAVALLLIVDFAALSRWFEFGNNDMIFVVLYTVLSAGIVAQLIAFLRVRLSNRDHEVSGNEGGR